jgi:hypothetical protein
MAKQTTAAAAPRPQWGCQSGAQGGRLAVAGARCALRLRRRRRASQRKGAGLHPCLVCCCCCCRLQAAGFRQAAKEREREREPNKRQQQAAAACTVVSGRHRHARLMYSSESACDLLPVQRDPRVRGCSLHKSQILKASAAGSLKGCAVPCVPPRRQAGGSSRRRSRRVAHSPPWSRGQDMDRPRSGRTGQAAAQSTPLRLRAVITALLGSS